MGGKLGSDNLLVEERAGGSLGEVCVSSPGNSENINSPMTLVRPMGVFTLTKLERLLVEGFMPETESLVGSGRRSQKAAPQEIEFSTVMDRYGSSGASGLGACPVWREKFSAVLSDAYLAAHHDSFVRLRERSSADTWDFFNRFLDESLRDFPEKQAIFRNLAVREVFQAGMSNTVVVNGPVPAMDQDGVRSLGAIIVSSAHIAAVVCREQRRLGVSCPVVDCEGATFDFSQLDLGNFVFDEIPSGAAQNHQVRFDGACERQKRDITRRYRERSDSVIAGWFGTRNPECRHHSGWEKVELLRRMGARRGDSVAFIGFSGYLGTAAGSILKVKSSNLKDLSLDLRSGLHLESTESKELKDCIEQNRILYIRAGEAGYLEWFVDVVNNLLPARSSAILDVTAFGLPNDLRLPDCRRRLALVRLQSEIGDSYVDAVVVGAEGSPGVPGH